MDNDNSSKKITKLADDGTAASSEVDQSTGWVASDESKAQAKKYRIIAILCWIVAIAFEVWAIMKLKEKPINMAWMIGLIVADLAFAITGNILWKKANRFDPASEKDKVRFFIQNQLGVIISFIAFLPLVILIFTNKNMTGKQKGILGSIAIGALALAGITGADFNPPSQEQYAEQTKQVELLNGGSNSVYWTKTGKSYHLYQDCSYINSKRTTEIFNGTVAQARELKKITDLCDRCQRKAVKANATKTLETEEPEGN